MIQTQTFRALAVAFAVAIAAPSAQATLQDGLYEFEIGEFAPLVVVDGDANFGALLPFSALCKKFKTDPKGVVKGKCDISIPVPGNPDVKGKLKGDISQEDGKMVARQNLELNAKIKANGIEYKIRWEYDVKIVWVIGADTFTWTLGGKACFDGRCDKTKKTTQTFPATILQDAAVVVTNWSLGMDVETKDDGTVKGVATVTLENGKELSYKVKGTCIEGVANLKFKPDGKKARGSRMKLKDATQDELTGQITGTMVYDVFGNASTDEDVVANPVP